MSQPFRCLKKYDDFTEIDGEFEVFLQPQRFAISGGGVMEQPTPQFDFVFWGAPNPIPSA
jgi:hypothetical protein